MPRGDLRGALGAQIVDLVERHHYDRRAAAAWARKHRDYAQTLVPVTNLSRGHAEPLYGVGAPGPARGTVASKRPTGGERQQDGRHLVMVVAGNR
jgi:hypothetical protein